MKDKSLTVGIEIGAVSVKWVVIGDSGIKETIVKRHGGNPAGLLSGLFDRFKAPRFTNAAVTGEGARQLINFPYVPESECLEKAISYYKVTPDLLISLGGETFSVFPVKNGKIWNIIATSKCAAGTGEFIIQQFQRMGMSLHSGMEQAKKGKLVELATRCSVHCKSDATHKLNKGECEKGDIAFSLIHNLVIRVREMVESANWPLKTILLTGGVTKNRLFVDLFRKLNPESDILLLPESDCLEAFGAALLATETLDPSYLSVEKIFRSPEITFSKLVDLKNGKELMDYRAGNRTVPSVSRYGQYILGIDAGSTTTKAILFNILTRKVDTSCYLRTHGNPVVATKKCLGELDRKIEGKEVSILQVGVTGSGREMVSVYLGNCPSYNEIITHARAASQVMEQVETVFEIGGQDSKFISFHEGIPVDYAMNEGCSAGTGSFLEESASVDMGIPMEEISLMALSSNHPIAFGERCAAFIDTDLRTALQQGARKEDVVAGLVYSIADNYISRIAGPRYIGDHVMFMGGVALNEAVACAMALRTGKKVTVPPYPEIMGCVGTALLILDQIQKGFLKENNLILSDLLIGEPELKGTFTCKSCDNLCEIQKIRIDDATYPYGGLCSLYENRRYGKKESKQVMDLIGFRNVLMFDKYHPDPPRSPIGRIGIPLSLSTWEFYPLYVKWISELGFEPVLPDFRREGQRKKLSPICYPCEITHGDVDDLIRKEVDHILIPRLIAANQAQAGKHGYTCSSTASIPDIIRAAFEKESPGILSPLMGLTEELGATTRKEFEKLGSMIGIEPGRSGLAYLDALEFYNQFRYEYLEEGSRMLEMIEFEPSVILAGRPYTIFPPNVNLALPRKIVSRGYHVIPFDMLPVHKENITDGNFWHYTALIENAIAFVKERSECHICLVSCFSCGPDAEMYHHFRRDLSGETFCYLEIDSHTAHAGFETRLGAFLDIVELRKSKLENTGYW